MIASLFGATGVALGAYASHGLSAIANATQVEYFQLAVTYQLFHSLALFAAAMLSLFIPSRILLSSQLCFVLGICFFSGSLYLYALTGTKILGAITPVGGMLLIIAWLLTTVSLLSFKNNNQDSAKPE